MTNDLQKYLWRRCQQKPSLRDIYSGEVRVVSMANLSANENVVRRESAKLLVSGLYTEWYGPLVRYAYRAIGSLETAEDVVQASFTELYRAILEGKAIASPRGWTLCVVRREIVDRLREQKRHGGPFLSLASAE